MDSNEKLTSLLAEADDTADVALVDGFGGGGVNVGMTNFSFSRRLAESSHNMQAISLWPRPAPS